MPIFAFIDDSGSDPSDPLYVLGGFVAPIHWWADISVGWQFVLNSEPKVEYYKASEVWDFEKGAFVALSKAERMAKVDALVDVLTEYSVVAVSCRMRWSVFKEFESRHALPIECRNPYFFLFYGIISRLMVMTQESPFIEHTYFTFDEHGKIGKQVQGWYERFRGIGNDEWQALLGPAPRFGNEKDLQPLQCADMLAWYQRRAAMGTLNEWNQNVWKRLSRKKSSWEIDAEGLLSMAGSLRLLNENR